MANANAGGHACPQQRRFICRVRVSAGVRQFNAHMRVAPLDHGYASDVQQLLSSNMSSEDPGSGCRQAVRPERPVGWALMAWRRHAWYCE